MVVAALFIRETEKQPSYVSSQAGAVSLPHRAATGQDTLIHLASSACLLNVLGLARGAEQRACSLQVDDGYRCAPLKGEVVYDQLLGCLRTRVS